MDRFPQSQSRHFGWHRIRFRWLPWLLLTTCLITTPVYGDLASFWENLVHPQPQTPPPAVVQVMAQEDGALAMGSGTLIHVDGRHGWVLSNWHVVRGATGAIEVVFPDGFRSPAQVMRTDETWDLALLAIWQPPTSPMRLAEQTPSIGEPITIGGYGQGQFRLAKGKVRNYASPQLGRPDEMIDVTVRARQGDSGGPMINDRGELAGVLFGSGSGMTTGSHIGRVKQFLLEACQTASPNSLEVADRRHDVAEIHPGTASAAQDNHSSFGESRNPQIANHTAPLSDNLLPPPFYPLSAGVPALPAIEDPPEKGLNQDPVTTVASADGSVWHPVERTARHVDPLPSGPPSNATDPVFPSPQVPAEPRVATVAPPAIDNLHPPATAGPWPQGSDPLAGHFAEPMPPMREEIVELPIPVGGTGAFLAFLALFGGTMYLAPRPRVEASPTVKPRR